MENLKDKLYEALVASPLGVVGAEQTLPGLEALLREVKARDFWAGKRTRRLAEEQMIRTWAEYRRDLRELRERLRQREQGWDELLSWLVFFTIEHCHHLAHVSALESLRFKAVLEAGSLGGQSPEDALAARDDWQAFVVAWLRDALLDESLDVAPPVGEGSATGGGDGDQAPGLRPTPKPDPDDDTPGFEY